MKKPYIDDLYAQKVADALRIPLEYVLKFRDEGMMNQAKVRDRIIYYDFVALAKTDKFTVPQMVEKLAGIYGVSTTKIYNVIKIKPKRIYYCKRCGAEISKPRYDRDNGLCARCFSKSVI